MGCLRPSYGRSGSSVGGSRALASAPNAPVVGARNRWQALASVHQWCMFTALASAHERSRPTSGACSRALVSAHNPPARYLQSIFMRK